MNVRIGIDVGGVVIDARANDGTDTDLRGERFMEAAPVHGAIEGMRWLVSKFGRPNVVIISKCGENMQRRTLQWFAGNCIYDRTGFDPANMHFCRQRRQKAGIATRLSLTDFVDDRLDVLRYMQESSVENLFLFGEQEETQNTSDTIEIASWSQLIEFYRRG
jgi:hypothetical protein